MKKIYVTKASGKKEPFSEEKIRSSVQRIGAPRAVENQVVAHVKDLIYEGVPTKDIYQEVLKSLEKSTYPQGKGKYSLKQAIMALGPSGYPFEEFIGEVFRSRGYQVETGVIEQGKCAEHELDVVATKAGSRFLVECKFHNRSGTKTDIKVALYLKARFDDLSHEFGQGLLVTNTKFTRRAIRYAQCVNLQLLGWNYPEDEPLRIWLESSGLHPITCLFSLSSSQKRRLLDAGIVLCRDFAQRESRVLRKLGLSSGLVKEATKEARLVCNL